MENQEQLLEIDFSLPDERWLLVKGYGDHYAVSDFGRVASHQLNKKGEGWQLLEGWIDSKGYRRIEMYFHSVKMVFKIHRLVGKMYIKNPLQLPMINHKDTDKLNNYYKNLEWCNNSHNQKHAYANGLKSAKGEDNANSKLTSLHVRALRDLSKQGYSMEDLMKIFPVNKSTTNKIINRKLWAHI